MHASGFALQSTGIVSGWSSPPPHAHSAAKIIAQSSLMSDGASSVENTFGGKVGGMGFLRSVVTAKINHAPGNMNSGAELPTRSGYAKGFGFVTVAAQADVFSVSDSWYVAEICQPIVRLDTIDMVNFVCRPSPGHVEPRNTMGKIPLRVERNPHIAFKSASSHKKIRPVANVMTLRKARKPRKDASLCVVVQNTTHAVSGTVLFH